MLYFPVKSEIVQNFRVHPKGVAAVNCRKMVLCVVFFRGMTSDEMEGRGEEAPPPRIKEKEEKKIKKKKHDKKMFLLVSFL